MSKFIFVFKIWSQYSYLLIILKVDDLVLHYHIGLIEKKNGV